MFLLCILTLVMAGCRSGRGLQGGNAVNGPFIVAPVSGPVITGLTGQKLSKPFEVQVKNAAGQLPRNNNGRNVAVRVQFSIVDATDPNALRFDQTNSILNTNEQGRAIITGTLGTAPGVYYVRATLPDFKDCVNAYFKVLTEDVVAKLEMVDTIPRVSVENAANIRVRALDFRGVPVPGKKIGILLGTEDPPRGDFPALSDSGGIYNFSVTSQAAGTFPLFISEAQSGTSLNSRIEFTAGSLRLIEFLPSEDPREKPPYNQTVIKLAGSDLYGNPVQLPQVNWTSSSGSIVPFSDDPSQATLQFGTEPVVKLQVQAGDVVAERSVDLYGVYLRPNFERAFVGIGDTFGMRVNVFPDQVKGTVTALQVNIQSTPGAAKFLGIRDPDPGDSIPLPLVSVTSEGLITLTYEGVFIPLTEGIPLLSIAEITWLCFNEQTSCAAVTKSLITVRNSPPQTNELHPGMSKCNDQKRRNPANICIKFCLVPKPGGKSLEDLKKLAREHVVKFETLYNNNIDSCCPFIKLDTCFEELSWADFRTIANGTTNNDILDDGIYDDGSGSTYDGDKTKNAWDDSNELVELFKKCRKDKCIPVYIVPEYTRRTSGGWGPGYGTTRSPRDFPELSNAQGSGPGIIIDDDLAPADASLAHELGHLLIDKERDDNSGDEHSDDTDRIMYKHESATRAKFLKSECNRINGSIGNYNGRCN